MKRILTQKDIIAFQEHLIQEEKSAATVEKYKRDVNAFLVFSNKRPITKELSIEYKKSLIDDGYAIRSINSMLASLNSLFVFLDWNDCKVKNLRTQRQTYCAEEKELTKAEYLQLLKISESRPRLHLLLQTICGTGIRVSELAYFTVEAVRKGVITVSCKNKTRTILIPGKLKKLLLSYTKRTGIDTGIIFRTRSGKPMNRSNIWADMKKLCRQTGISPSKVFPHNLRKLFARTFYAMEKDIAKLADILGHSSVNTTRIYIMATGVEHRRRIERLGLVV
ncbi:MAG: tyrosine-type recombinase/integrase [Oscillospiraceae bacterium]